MLRGRDDDEADEAVAEDVALRGAAFVDITVETAGLSVDETVALLRPHVRMTGPSNPARPPRWVLWSSRGRALRAPPRSDLG